MSPRERRNIEGLEEGLNMPEEHDDLLIRDGDSEVTYLLCQLALCFGLVLCKAINGECGNIFRMPHALHCSGGQHNI